MEYYDCDEGRDKDRLIGWLSVGIYCLAVAVACFVVRFRFSDRLAVYPPPPEGVMITLGDESAGFGDQPIPEAIAEEKATPTPPVPVQEEAPDDRPDPDGVIRVNHDKEVPPAKPKKEAPAEKPRTVNINALYKSNKPKSGTEPRSQGTVAGATGNTGSPDGSLHSLGDSQSGTFSLEGRRLNGALARPAYNNNEEGRVVMEIYVNRSGEVTKALFLPNRSTTSNHELVREAERAALKTRFNQDEKDNFTQVGTITYIFKIK